MRTAIFLSLIVMFTIPRPVFAEIDTELRFKFGSAPGTDRIQIDSTIGHGPDDHGTNVQVEAVVNRHRNSTANFIMALGFFYRQHDGEINNLPDLIKVDYSAYGLSIAPGLRLRIAGIWNIEAKVEFCAGKADSMMLDSPGINWSVLETEDYVAVSPIVGFYYLFENAASRIGVEFGNQKFWGDFELWTAGGSRSHGTVSGRNVTASVVYGIQF